VNILGYFCCKIDYSRETDDKIITFELYFMRCGNFFGTSAGCSNLVLCSVCIVCLFV